MMHTMDIMTISIQPQMAQQHQRLLQIEPKHSAVPSWAVKEEIQSDKITISPEARTKVSENSVSEKSRSALHDLATKGQEENTVEKQSLLETIDSMIEELKKKISELMQQISKLYSKVDRESLEQQKVLEVQLAALNSQLMELTGRKLEMLEHGKD